MHARVTRGWLARLEDFAGRITLCNVLVLALALVPRLVVAFWLPDAIIWEDGNRYVKVALILLDGDGFGGIYENWLSVPTQPLLIAGLLAVFGKSSLLSLRIAFAVLGTFSCLLGSVLARRMFGAVAGLLAGLMLAFYPHLIYLSATFEYPQTLFIFFMAVFFLLQWGYRQKLKLHLLFIASLFLGLATVTVPVVIAFVPLFVLTLLTRRPAQFLARALVVLAAVAIPLGSWALRNYAAYGEFVLVNKAASSSFWSANNETYYQYGKKAIAPVCGPGNENTSHCLEHRDLDAQLVSRAGEGIAVVDYFEAESWRHGFEFVRASPWRFVKLTARKAVQFWSPIPDAVQATDETSLQSRNIISIATYVPMMLLALASMLWLASRWRDLLPWYLYILTIWGLYSVFLPEMRYRLPLDYMLLIVGAAGLARLLERARRQKSLESAAES
jgi:4-amino-4-deoxy-L-arabinose transferase-like glycosyltransferase